VGDDPSKDSLHHLRSYFVGCYFYQGWKDVEGTPHEIGERYASSTSRSEAERMLGLLETFLAVDVSDDVFAAVCGFLGMNYKPKSASPSHRDLLVEASDGMRRHLAQNMQQAMTSDGRF